MDMSLSFGAPFGAVCSDVASTLQINKNALDIFNVIYGLGGRDITPKEIEGIFEDALNVAKTGNIKENVRFVGVRE